MARTVALVLRIGFAGREDLIVRGIVARLEPILLHVPSVAQRPDAAQVLVIDMHDVGLGHLSWRKEGTCAGDKFEKVSI